MGYTNQTRRERKYGDIWKSIVMTDTMHEFLCDKVVYQRMSGGMKYQRENYQGFVNVMLTDDLNVELAEEFMTKFPEGLL